MPGRSGRCKADRMKRVVVDHFRRARGVAGGGGRRSPAGAGRGARRGCWLPGVSFTDSQLRAGTYLGVPKPPFTPGYELVGVVEELGPGCSKLKVGDRIGALTVWAPTRSVCVPEANAVEVPRTSIRPRP